MGENKPKPGPKEDRLVLDGDWQERVKDAVAKKKPEGGWPKPAKTGSEDQES